MDYAEASTRYVFDNASGDAVADKILAAIQTRPNGMSRTEVQELFARNRSGDEISRALDLLQRTGAAAPMAVPTAGRSAERWLAADAPLSLTKETTEAPRSAASGLPSVVNIVSVVPVSSDETEVPS